jgi:hypothetical protein
MRLIADSYAAKARAGSRPFDGIGLLNLVDFVGAEFWIVD